MATGKSYYARPSYRFLGTDQPSYFTASDSGLEFDESDLFNPIHSDSPDFCRKISSSVRSGKKIVESSLRRFLRRSSVVASC